MDRELVRDEEQEVECMLIKPIVKMLKAVRSESPDVNPNEVQSDVNDLMNISGTILDGDYRARLILKKILYYKSFKHIKAVDEEYARKSNGKTLLDAVKEAYSFSIASDNVFNCIRQFALSESQYYAWALQKSMKGLGTMDHLLIHIVVRRCEVSVKLNQIEERIIIYFIYTFQTDMVSIKEEFRKLTGESLKKWIEGDTSRHYKKGLVALIGEKNN